MQIKIRTNIGMDLADMSNRIHRRILKAANEASKELYNIVQSKYVAPISRTGKFAKSVKLLPATVVEGNRVKWGIEFGSPYAKALVGPKGTTLRIYPRRGRTSIHPGSEPHLAIPIGQGLNSDGTPKYRSPWQIRDLQLIVSHDKAYLAIKPSKDTFIPYFILKEIIEVQRQIDPDDIKADARNLIRMKLRENLKDIVK